MFKRRELSLPSVDSSIFGAQSPSIKLPPIVPPKPKSKIKLEQNKNEVTEQDEMKSILPFPMAQSLARTNVETSQQMLEQSFEACESSSTPVDQIQPGNEHLSSMLADNSDCETLQNMNIEDNSPLIEVEDISQKTPPTTTTINKESIQTIACTQKDDKIKDNLNDTKNDKNSDDSCDFIIYQRQYSMRAIMLDDVTPTNLGLMLSGGLDSKRKEVTINQIATGSVAERDARLQIGDRIVSINGKSVMAMMHDETEDLLQEAAQSGKVLLVVSRPLEGNEKSSRECSPTTTPLISESFTNVSFIQTDTECKRSPYNSLEHNPGSCRQITAEIMKDFNGLGFIIEGGYSPLGDRPITIKRIFRGGPVDKEGSLVEGDELQSINDQSIAGMSRAEVWSYLKQLPDGKVQLTVRRIKRYL